MGSSLKNKKIVFLGVTFKPNTDDMRDSTSLKMIPFIIKKGANVEYYDPTGEKKEFKKLKNCKFNKSVKNICEKADLIVLHTEWDEFKSLDFKRLIKKKNFKIFDLRNLYNFNEMMNNKIKYYFQAICA